MSHVMTKAELNMMRKKQLANNVDSIIASYCQKCRDNTQLDSLKDLQRLRDRVTNRIAVSEFGFEETTFSQFQDAVLDETEFSRKKDQLLKTVEFDLSALKSYSPVLLGSWKNQMRDLLEKADERAMINQADVKAKERVLLEVKNIWEDQSLDPEDRIRMISMKIDAYLESGISIKSVDFESVEKEYLEYLALCEVLGIEPRESLPEEISILLPVMRKQAVEEEERIYIAETLQEIMKTLGCQQKSSAILKRREGHLYELDDESPFDIFISDNMKQVVFEPVRNTQNLAVNEAAGAKVCSIYEKLQSEALKRDIILSTVYQDPVAAVRVSSESQTEKRNETSVKRKSKRHKKVREMEF